MKHALACLSLMLLALLAACAPILTPAAPPAPAGDPRADGHARRACRSLRRPWDWTANSCKARVGSPGGTIVSSTRSSCAASQDSDGDGIGDLKGSSPKLDYLNDGDPATTADLGVTGIWLMPIAVAQLPRLRRQSTTTQVNPDYGTNDDFERLSTRRTGAGIR